VATSTVVTDAFGVTDAGRKRNHNEDQFLIAGLNKAILIEQTSLAQPDNERLMSESQGKLLVVADGMGGHGGGDIASSVAVDATLNYVLNIMPWFFRLDESQEDDLEEELKSALQRSHSSVRAAAEEEGRHPRMGTTLTMAYIVWPRLYVVHVGDSRCYLFRDSDLEQITTDHTLAEQLSEARDATEEKAPASRWSNVLWNAVGGDDDGPAPEVYKAKLEPGDLLLLCSDGLTEHVSNDELREQLRGASGNSESLAKELVQAANDGGGSDNITVIVARFG